MRASQPRRDIVEVRTHSLDNTEFQKKKTNASQEVIRAEDRLDVGGNLEQYGQGLMLCRGQIRWE